MPNFSAGCAGSSGRAASGLSYLRSQADRDRQGDLDAPFCVVPCVQRVSAKKEEDVCLGFSANGMNCDLLDPCPSHLLLRQSESKESSERIQTLETS